MSRVRPVVGNHAVAQRSDISHEMLVVAQGEIGVREVGTNRGPRVRIYQQFAGITGGQPWCAAFATWCVYQAASRLGVKPKVPRCASSQGLYQWARASGALLSHPEPGCIGLERGEGGHHHTFMVTSVRGHQVASIDGNYGDAVRRTFHPIHRCDFMRVY